MHVLPTLRLPTTKIGKLAIISFFKGGVFAPIFLKIGSSFLLKMKMFDSIFFFQSEVGEESR